jgi:hypothetical protein
MENPPISYRNLKKEQNKPQKPEKTQEKALSILTEQNYYKHKTNTLCNNK